MSSRFLEPDTGVGTLSARVRALTSYLLDNIAPPSFLAAHGKLLLAFTCSAAAGTALYAYIHCNRTNRAKINLAVYHITRMVETTPEYQDRLYNPHDLVQIMNAEVKHILDVHLNGNEAASTMLKLKRKLWKEFDENSVLVKRRRKNNVVEREESLTEHDSDMKKAEISFPESYTSTTAEHGDFEAPPDTKSDKLHESVDMKIQEDPMMADIDGLYTFLTMPRQQESLHSRQSSPTQQTPLSQKLQTSQDSSSSKILSSDKSQTSEVVVEHNSVLKATSSLSPDFPTRSPIDRDGYDSSPPLPPYDDQIPSDYSSSSGSESGAASPCPTQRSKVHASSSYGFDYDEELYSSSSSDSSSSASPNREEQSTSQSGKRRSIRKSALGHAVHDSHGSATPKAKKPTSSVKIQLPPNSMAFLTGDSSKGTWLSSIQEGVSPHKSPATDVTQYRVAESKRFYKRIQAERRARRSFRDFFKRSQNNLQSRTKKVEVSWEKEEVEWRDHILANSGREERSEFDDNAHISSSQQSERPPSTPEMSSPIPFPSTSPLPESDVDPPSMMEVENQPMPDDASIASTPPKFQASSSPSIPSSPPSMNRSHSKVFAEEEVIVRKNKPDTPAPANRVAHTVKVNTTFQMPGAPASAPRSRGYSRQATAEPQTPVQTTTPLRRSLRSSTFKGSYKM